MVAAGLCALVGAVALAHLELVQVTPTASALALARRLSAAGQVEKLQKIADSAPESPLGQVMSAGLEARRQARDPVGAMKRTQAAGALSRSLLTLLAGLLVLVTLVVLAVGRKSLSRLAVGLLLAGFGLSGGALLVWTQVERELEQAIQVLGPLLA